jgi:hypothetical protein
MFRLQSSLRAPKMGRSSFGAITPLEISQSLKIDPHARYLEALETRLATLETRLSHTSASSLPPHNSASLAPESSPGSSDASPFRHNDEQCGIDRMDSLNSYVAPVPFNVGPSPTEQHRFLEEDDSGDIDLGYYGRPCCGSAEDVSHD